jgi:hypothetical protein
MMRSQHSRSKRSARTDRPAISEALEPRRLLSGGSWLQLATLLASDGSAGDNLGWSVALSGNTALVGSAFDDDNGTDAGSAYLFNANTGQQIAKLKPTDGAASDNFGHSVAIEGNIALVGSPYNDDNGDSSGSAYLFDVTTGTQVAKLIPNDGTPEGWFGQSVALSGNVAIVGSTGDSDNGPFSGSAYLFDINTGQQVGKLKPVDGEEFDGFGISVAISGNIALVGSWFDDDNGADSGAAYLFDITTGTQLAKLKPADGAAEDLFGYAVALSGNTALIGSYADDDNGGDSGSAYLFNVTTGTQIAKLKPTDGAPNDFFGASVALSGNIALVGSYGDDDNGADSGSAYLFDATTGTQIAKLKPVSGAGRDNFGYSVALSGNAVLVGSYGHDANGPDSGSAYVFDFLVKPEIEVRGNDAVIVDGDATPDSTDHTDFGEITLGSTLTRTFTVFNTGNVFLTTSGLTVPAGFTVVDGLAAIIPAGGFDSFSVRFNATTADLFKGEVRFENNDANENPFNFEIRALVKPPEVEVRGNDVVISDNDTTPDFADHTDFGEVPVGSSLTRTFTVRNTGTGILTTSGLSLPSGFTLTEGLAPLILPGGQDTFSIRFSSNSIVTRTGNVSFNSNDPDENPFNFAVRAVAVAPEIEVLGNGIVIVDGDTFPRPQNHTDFGIAFVGSLLSRTFTVRNTGNSALTTTNLTVPAGFTIAEGLSSSIPAGTEDTFTVRLNSDVTGVYRGTVSFDTNDANENPFNFVISATLQVPWLQLRKLRAVDNGFEDRFGFSVAISGETALVGSPYDDDNGSSSGSAYLIDITTGRQIAKLKPDDGAAGGYFGFSVALSGDTALVGSDSGSAYLFNATTGAQITKLKPADGAAFDGWFGISVAINGNTAIVGSYRNANGTASGSAYLFDITTGQQIAKLDPADGAAGDWFGYSVALSGNRALIGSCADDDNGTSSGSAYLFDITTGQQIAKLKPADGAAGDYFGWSVAITGNIALVGSPFDDDNGTDSGSAYLFDVVTGAQIAKLRPSDGDSWDYFSRSVAISGNTALVGSPLDDDSGTDSGSAYVFDTTTGQQIAKLKPADGAAGDYFGWSVAISGNTVVVGSRDDDVSGADSGSAYVFAINPPDVEVLGNNVVIDENDTTPALADHTDFGNLDVGSERTRTFTVRNTGTGVLATSGLSVPTGFTVTEGLAASIAPGAQDTFTVRLGANQYGTYGGQISFATNDHDERHFNFAVRGVVGSFSAFQAATLLASDGSPGDRLGLSVAISGNIALVGSYLDDDNGTSSGSAYLFNAATGTQIAKLMPGDGAAFDFFGRSVAIFGNLALVGSPRDDDNGTDSGSAYLFDVSTGQQLMKLKPADGAIGDNFGASVSLSHGFALIGSPRDDESGEDSGSAYLFDVATGQQLAKLDHADSGAEDYFGESVAISGTIAVVGSYGDDASGTDSGSAYVFDVTTGQLLAKFEPTDGAAFDTFGRSVAISGSIVLIGSSDEYDNGSSSGSAYLFDITTRQQIAKLRPVDADVDFFGWSVAISGNTAVVSSHLDDDNGINSGSVYLFDATTGTQIAKITPSEGEAGNYFGFSVAISGNTALVGSYRDNASGEESGSAQVFVFDDDAPQTVSSTLVVDEALQWVVTFDEAVDPATVDLSAIVATRVGQAGGANPVGVTWSANNTVATFTFPTLPDGDYRFTLAAGAVKDVSGNSLASAVTLEGPDVFILAGDANRDRTVDFVDLLIVAQNYGQSGKTFSQGNFDYSPDGLVDFSDLLILAQNYNTSVVRVEPRHSVFASRTTPRRSPLDHDEPSLI